MPVRFIAEVSSNHHGDLPRCLAFIDAAADIGCDAVKFQLFRIEELFAPEILRLRPELQRRKAWELPPAFLPTLAQRCRDRRIQFSCTPFYLDAVDELLPHVDFFKVASYELMWHDLLAACARTGKPLVLSTGMATLPEIAGAVRAVRDAGGRDLTLLHCVSGYPTPVAECNLAAIETLRREFGCPAGWSDHSVNPDVVFRAVTEWKAAMVEFHLDLDGQGDEFKTGHCWLPEQIAPVIARLRSHPVPAPSHVPTRLPMDGDGRKEPAPCELPDRAWRADPVDGLRPLRSTRIAYVAEHGGRSS